MKGSEQKNKKTVSQQDLGNLRSIRENVLRFMAEAAQR